MGWMTEHERDRFRRTWTSWKPQPTKRCRTCGQQVRWGQFDDRWILLDAAPNPAGAWALYGGTARPAWRASPGADWSRHDRHHCEPAS
jgi:hypothetical protein